MKQQLENIVVAFNDCINRQDLDDLARLMTDDHNFIDSAGGTVTGKTACLKAWASFFSAFPDYHNQFDRIIPDGNKVTIMGNSICSDSRLSGPALWQAVFRGHQLVEWRIYEDTPSNRAALGITN